MTTRDEVQVLKLTLHQHLVGYLAGYRSGRNRLTFAESFVADPARPTLSLITHPLFPKAPTVLSTPWVRTQRLHPVLSNLLPEGALRALIADQLKVHPDNEFRLFSHMGHDLPGALIATPLAPDEVPLAVLNVNPNARPVPFDKSHTTNRFSLAGVQMKFSVKAARDRYTLTTGEDVGDWIVKTPSTIHKHVPQNEYSAMRLAALAGVDIPEIRLVPLGQLDSLPPINLPDEQQAFAIKRFDRHGDGRIHTEDFAQVLVKYPHEKYDAANYDQIARIISQFSGDRLADLQQLARRLLVNLLLANGDAHLKNWSLIYADQITPRLSPAYDIVTTQLYMENERHSALKLAGNKDWYSTSMEHFDHWAKNLGIPRRLIRAHLQDTLDKARTLWPSALKNLPITDPHQAALRQHWRQLDPDFRITN